MNGVFCLLQGEQCHNLAAQLKKQYPDMAAPVLIEAAQFVKEKKADQAQKLLNVGVLLLLSQFYNFSQKSLIFWMYWFYSYVFQNLKVLLK